MTALAEPPPRRRTAPPPIAAPAPYPAPAPVAAPPPVRDLLSVADSVFLRGVSWDTYVAVRDDPGNDGLRMTYDRGELEIMTLSRAHEEFSRTLLLLIAAWCEERALAYSVGGSLTMRRELIGRGLEPDECFFVRSVERVRGRDGWDEESDPPPDLAVEVVVSRSAIPKLPIYAALGVPEVWVWEGGALSARRLSGATHPVVGESVELTGFPLGTAADLLRRTGERVTSELVAEFRDAVRVPGRDPGDRSAPPD